MITISKSVPGALTGHWHHTIESESYTYLDIKNFAKASKNIMELLKTKLKSDDYSIKKDNSSIVSAVENFIEEWSNHVHFINYQEIKEYLKKHVELIDKLPIAIEIAKKHFPDSHVELIDKLPIAIEIAKKHFPDSQIALEYYQDPEIDDKYIAIYVRLKDYDETFIDRLLTASNEIIETLGVDYAEHISLDTDYEQIS